MSKSLSFADVSMLATVAEILKNRGVWSVSITSGGSAEILVSKEAFVTARQDTPAEMTVSPHGTTGVWRASFAYGGTTFFALFARNELHLVGYQVATPPPVVPLAVEEVHN